MKWLQDKVDGAVKKEMTALTTKVLEDLKVRLDDIHQSQRKFQQEVSKEIDSRLKNFDLGIKTKFDVMADVLTKQMVTVEGNVDDKISGLYSSLDDKISKGNGNGRAFAGVMKRLAQLEDIKDAVEHRRSSQVLIERRDEIKRQLVDLHREDKDISGLQIELNTINWVLGESGE